MNENKKLATITGILFIVAAVCAIAGLALYSGIIHNTRYILETGINHTATRWGAFFEIITAFAVIGTSITLYPILNNYSQVIAIATVCFRVLEATFIVIGILCMLSIVSLNQEFVKGNGSDIPSLLTAGKLLLTIHDWTFLFGPNIMLGPSTFLTSYVLFRMNLVPRFISILGLIAGPLILVSGLLVVFDMFLQISLWGVIFALPVFIYEISFAIWLIIKGFDLTERAIL